MRKRTTWAWGAAIVCFVVLMIVTPAIPQNEAYHDFTDQRNFFRIPNALNVIFNFPFIVVGIVGLILCHYKNYFRFSLQGELWGWTLFFIGVGAVRIGSSYYHLHPDDARLVWDRLPRVDVGKGTLSIVPLLLAGVISILYWSFFDDLRPYAIVQFVPCIAMPLMAILFPPMYTHSSYWLWAAAFYLMAKIEEAEDKQIYNLDASYSEWTHVKASLCCNGSDFSNHHASKERNQRREGDLTGDMEAFLVSIQGGRNKQDGIDYTYTTV